MTLEALIVVNVVLQLLDIITTYKFMKNKTDGITEGNQFMARLMKRLGLKLALALKAVVAAGFLYAVYTVAGNTTSDLLFTACIAALYLASAGMAVVVLHNIKLIRSAG